MEGEGGDGEGRGRRRVFHLYTSTLAHPSRVFAACTRATTTRAQRSLRFSADSSTAWPALTVPEKNPGVRIVPKAMSYLYGVCDRRAAAVRFGRSSLLGQHCTPQTARPDGIGAARGSRRCRPARDVGHSAPLRSTLRSTPRAPTLYDGMLYTNITQTAGQLRRRGTWGHTVCNSHRVCIACARPRSRYSTGRGRRCGLPSHSGAAHSVVSRTSNRRLGFDGWSSPRGGRCGRRYLRTALWQRRAFRAHEALCSASPCSA